MTRLSVAFAGPAALLGGLTMSTVLVVGNAEISQLRVSEDRRSPAVVQAESPFRVIGGIDVPEPAPPRESVPSPSAAVAPAADLPAPPSTPPDDLLGTGGLPDDVTGTPGPLRRPAYQVAEHAPEPADDILTTLIEAPVKTVRDTVTGLLGHARQELRQAD